MTNYIAHVYFIFATQSVCAQGLLEMEFALPTDSTEASGLSLLRRLWVARFDVEEEGRALAEKYVCTKTHWSLHGCLFHLFQQQSLNNEHFNHPVHYMSFKRCFFLQNWVFAL